MTDKVKLALLAMQRHNWEQGVAAQAFLEAGDAETAIALAIEGANRQHTDGRCCHLGDSDAVTDPCAVGEALIFACEQTGDSVLCAARDRLLRWALHDAPRSGSGIVYHFLHGQLIWVDSMYMLPPFLARAGEYDEALRQLDASLLPAAERARAAALAEVDAYGLVRNVCGAPFFDRPGVAPEGQAFHLMMEAARAALHR